MRKIAKLTVLVLAVLLLIPTVHAAIVINGKTYYYNPASGTYVPYPVTIEEPEHPQAVKPQATATTGIAAINLSAVNNTVLETPDVPIPLWSVNYNTYTAQFIGEDEVIVYTSHGDIDLGHRYISVHPSGDAYIYDVKTGELLHHYAGGTDGGTWDLNTGRKVWGRSGFFSGNGMFLLEDPQAYGKNARVVDLETGTTYPINWTGTSGIYYASQVSESGTYIAVGENVNNGRVLVFKFNGTAYNLVWNSTAIGKVRRLFLTLDAQYLVYGALGNHYLYIAERTGDTFQVIDKIPLAGGVGALTCTDPYKIGYILVGTDNGHIYIFNTHDGSKISDPDLVIHLNSTQTGTTGRFYNPFYNRWNPATITMVAFSTSTDPYHSVIIDLKTGRYFKYSGSGYGKATAVSLQGNYLFAGRTLYMIVQQDIQSGNPRIRFIGDLVYNPSENHPWELNSAFVLSAPKNKPYHIYFQSGSLKVTYVESGKRPVVLTKNPAIRDGLLGKMYDMGLIKSAVLYTNGASVEDMSLKPIGSREIIFNRTHVFHNLVYSRIIGTAPSVADSGVVIQVPVDTDVSPYANLSINPKFSVAVVVPQFNLLHELIGVSGLEIAGSGAGFALPKLLSSEWLRSYLSRMGADILAIQDAESLLSRVVVRVGSKACIAVGVGLAIDTAVGTYTHYKNLKKYESIQTIVCTVPIFKDTKTGDVYAAVNVYLPSAATEQQAKMYRSHIVAYLEKTGVPASHISVRITYIPGSWQHYMTLIKDGQIRKANLLDLASTIPVPTSRLKITKIDLIISTVTEGYASLFDILKGGYKEAVGTVIVGDSIEVSGVVSSFHTRDPEKIVSLIPKVEINGRMYSLSPSRDGAITEFSLPIGTNTLVLKFPNSSYLRAIFKLKTQVLVKQDMVKKKGYYESNFHFDWKYGKNDLVLLTKRIEFVDMPYKMVYAERRIKVRNGKVLATNIGKFFELKQAINDAKSPTGKLYYYVTEHPKFLDPTEGAKMETCKRYDFRYWYIPPPKPYLPKRNETYPLNGTEPLPLNNSSSIGDAWVRLYLNGTTNTSTIPRMLVVWLGSTGTQNNTIKVRINERAGYLSKNDTPVYTMNKTFNLTKTLEPNSSCVQLYDIQKFIAEAIRHAPRGFFEASATIVQATYNNVMSDDYDRITYFPSPKLPPTGSVVALNVKVVNAANLTPISSAYVYLDNNLFGTTNLAGWANETTTTGYHTIHVIKDGYREYDSDLNVFDNMSVTIDMIPNNFPINDYRTLETLVVYNDGAPFPNAQVTVTDHNTGAILFNQTTDSLGIAKFLIPVGKVVDVHILAGNSTFNFTGITMNEDKRVVATLTANSNYFAPEVGITNVSLVTHWGMGWYYGSTQQYVRTVVFSNVPQTITLHYRAFDVNTNQTLNESDLTVKVHRGINYIMHWVSLNVRNQSRDVAVEVSIVKYEQDSDPANNVMVSNTVLIKPFVDLSVTVLWKPVKQKTPLAILPGDLIEVDVGFMIPCRLSGIDANVSINAHDLSASGFRMKPIERYSNKISSYKPNTTVWYNTTVVVPFTDEIVVNASINHPWEYMGWNNYANTTIPVFPDTAVMGVSIPSLLVQSGQKTDVSVNIKSNAIGRGATVSVVDENENTSLGIAYITITKPNMSVTIHANVPKIASVHTQSFNPASINISGMYEMHTWNISVATVDYYPQNDYKTINVRIWAIPWWVWATGILIVVLLVLAIVLKVVAILRTKSTPKYKYFKKLEGEEEIVSKDIMKVGKSEKRFRFFRRLK